MLTTTIDRILDAAISGHTLSIHDGLDLLLQTDQGALEVIRQAADELRKNLVGDRVTYVINRNINFTNICEQHCGFCAFRRDRNDVDAYWLDWEVIFEKATASVQIGATEICMQGGLNPHAKVDGVVHPTLAYYGQLLKALKTQFPDVHLHAFSPQEIQFIAREDGLDYGTVISTLQMAGLNSMPGTAAEVLDDSVRRLLCPEKINSATWLEIVSTAHRLGVHTTSTLLSGHIETPAHQIHHLERLRTLQQASLQRNYRAAFTEFILLPYVGQTAPRALRRKVGRDQPVLADALHLTAVARLFLGHWIPNHQPSWVKLGIQGAATALAWGCNDMGGTLMEEHITSMAGAEGGTCQSVENLQTAITSMNRPFHQRDTLYHLIPMNSSILKDHPAATLG